MKERYTIQTQDHFSEENMAVRKHIAKVLDEALASAGLFDVYNDINYGGMLYDQEKGLLSFLEHSVTLSIQYFAEVRMTAGVDIIKCRLLMTTTEIPHNARTDVYALYAHVGARCPFKPDNKALRITSFTLKDQSGNTDYALYTCPAKPIATINKFLATRGAPPLDTLKSNKLLADIKSIGMGASYTVELIEQGITISDVYYNEEKDVLFPSCMSGKPRHYFELYDNLQEEGILSLLRVWKCDSNGSIPVGRALLWRGKEGVEYLDRVYMYTLNSTPVEKAVQAMRECLTERGIMKCVHEPTAQAYGLMYRHINLSVPPSALRTDSLPYMDSFYYIDDDNGVLRTQCPSTHRRMRTARTTNGSVCESKIYVDGSCYEECDCIEVTDDITDLPVPTHMVLAIASEGDPTYAIRDSYRHLFTR